MLAGSDFSQFFDWKLALVSDGVFTYVVLTPTPRMFLIRHFGDQDRPMQGNDESERKMDSVQRKHQAKWLSRVPAELRRAT